MDRFKGFCSIVFPVKFYILFTVVWFFGMQSFFVLMTKEQLVFTREDFLSIVIVFLILFFIRVIDEIKDYEFDKKNNPERPLVKGVVTRKDLAIYALTVGLFIVILNYFNNNSPLPFVIISYTLFIWCADGLFNRVSVNSFFQLTISFPASLPIYIYYYFYFVGKYHHEYGKGCALFVIPFALSFLALEVLRKTSWKNTKDGLYSNDIGPLKSHILGTSLGIVGVVMCYIHTLTISEGNGYILLFPVLLLLANSIRFIILKNEKISARILPLLFLIGTYAMNIVLYIISANKI